MEARAVKKYISSSPRKMRLITDLIRRKSVKESLSVLKYSKKHSAKDVEKTLKSAYNNLLNTLDTGKIDTSEVFVKDIFVNGGPTLKRLLPAPQGRAFRVRKRSSHLTIIVENIEIKEDIKAKRVKTEKAEIKPKTIRKKVRSEKDEVITEEPGKKTKVKKEGETKKTSEEKKVTKPRTKKVKPTDTASADETITVKDNNKDKPKKGRPKKTNNKE